jgi:hypothetical protein
MQSSLERRFRYFKVSQIKAFRDIRHVHRYYFLQLLSLIEKHDHLICILMTLKGDVIARDLGEADHL